jgi:uncharacterized protein YgiM (DUF1202 family)
LLLSFQIVSFASLKDVTVTAESVNLRAGPGDRDDVVGQARRGEFLTMREGRKGEWIEIAAPDSISGWVYGELINDGIVAVSRLRVRAGPGINYAPIARLDQGDKVAVRGKKGEWLEIAPPVQSSLWVHEQFVSEIRKKKPIKVARAADPAPANPVTRPATGTKVVSPSSGRLEQKPAITQRLSKWRAEREMKAALQEAQPREKVVPERQDVQMPPPNAAFGQERRLPPGAQVATYEAGRRVVYRGTVRPMGMTVWRRPSPYRLVRYDRRSIAQTICYLKADEAELQSRSGQHVRLTGTEFRVSGVKQPVVVVESMETIREH